VAQRPLRQRDGVRPRRRGAAGQDDEASTQAVIARIHQDGTTWAGTTAWRGVTALRISVSGWKTTDEDVDRSIDAIRQLAAP
jgi:hypothetical protein